MKIQTSSARGKVSFALFFNFLSLFFLLSVNSQAQAYIKQSRYLGGSAVDVVAGTKIINGYKFIVSNASANAGTNTYPITTGSLNAGNFDVQVTKLNPDGTIAWSRFIGGSKDDLANDFIVLGNYIYIVGSTISSDFPVTDGSTFQSVNNNNRFLVKVDVNTGAIGYSTLRGMGEMGYIQYDNGYIYTVGNKNGKISVSRFDPAAENWLYENTYGGSGGSDYTKIEYPLYSYSPASGAQRSSFKAINGSIYLIGTANSDDFPVTDGSSPGYIVFLKLDEATGAISNSGYLGTPAFNTFYTYDVQVVNGETYFLGASYSSGFPTTTDGSTFTGISGSFYYPNLFIVKLDVNGHIVYAKLLASDLDQASIHANNFGMQVENGIVYIAGATYTITLPGASNSSAGDYDLMIFKLNATNGSLLYSGYIGSSAGDYFGDLKVVNGDMYITGMSSGSNYPVTNGSTNPSNFDMVFTKINSNNAICFSTYLGGKSSYEFPASINVIADSVYITGSTNSADFPVTDNSSFVDINLEDISFTQFVFNPAINGITDTLSPATQNVCNNGLPQLIQGVEITLVSDSMPKLYYNGVPSGQNSIVCRYQWQVADDPGGPWTNIPGAVQKDYTPQTVSVNQYYRRLAYTSGCSSIPASTSDVASVLVTADVAPTVDAGGVFYTCSGTPVTLGGSPTATPSGSATISTYEWTPVGSYSPGNNVSNPMVSPTVNTIYTVTVTDSKGCKNAGQAFVNVYKADAGPDKSACAGQSVRIGTAPIAGLTGVTYSWIASPSDPTMSCTNCAQPDVNPSVATTYTLSVTIPVTGGGSCTTNDQVTVTPVTGPTAGFAGPDITVCNNSSGTLGQAAQSGFTYTWTPGLYLDDVNNAQPTFTPGNINYPNPNPFVYSVTATKNGCSFTDQVQAFTIGANAGPDQCGPATIGTPDKTPDINETYAWTVVSGDGHIIGATDTPQINVSATTSGVTVYRLSVTYNGVTCTDDINITACGCVLPIITVDAPFSCPSYDINNGNVKLTASSSLASTFSWSPSTGLSSSTGATVTLTDNIPRTYTVTATSIADPSFSCTNTITVNQPGWAKPSFTAQEVTVCPNIPVQIGQATVAGYTYAWTGTGLDNNTISNPTATVNTTTQFPVLVTETVSGCTAKDTAIVSIPGFPGNLAGADISICGSSIVQLGSDPVAGVTYQWTPAASYDPGDNVANPKVLVTTTTTFHVQATNTATGCVADDDIVVTVNPAAPSISFIDQTFCPSTPGAIALPAGPSGMSAYSWSPSSLVQNPTSNGPTATTLNPRPSSATTYTLTVTNSNGCKSSGSVTLSPSIPNPVAGSNRTVCKNNSVQLGTSPGMPGIYSWSVSADPVSATYTLSSTSISNPVFTPTSAGTFTITVTYTESGCTTTDKVVITGNDYTIPTIPSPIVCQNTCTQIGISTPELGTQYSWSPVNGLSDPNISNPTACMGTSSQTYTLTAVGSNGCIATQDVYVAVNAQASPSVNIPSASACYGSGSTNFFPNISPSGTYQYLWSPDDGSMENIYVKNATVYITSTGTKKYFLNVTDGGTGCSSNAEGLLTSNYCVLPVKLKSFTATPQNNKVLLEWKVAEEINFAYYVVEHSINAYDFTVIGTKNGTHSPDYQLLHNNPVQGVNYYRLKMVDVDGKVTYSDVRKIIFNGTGNMADVKLYPNPADNMVHISLPKEMTNKKASILVIATDGRIVMKKQLNTLSPVETISTQQLTKGNYYIRIATEDNIIVNKPLIVLH